MSWIKNLFSKKDMQKEKQETEEKVFVEEKSITTNFLSYHDVTVSTTATTIDDLEQFVRTFESPLKDSLDTYCKYSIINAYEFMEETGEGFSIMFESGDEEEYEASFMKDFNEGKVEVLADFIDRWMSSEIALKVSQKAYDKKGDTEITLPELHRLVAEVMLEDHLQMYNYGNVYPAIKDRLSEEPQYILEFMRLSNINIYESGSEYVIELDFDCDWEEEHGIAWTFLNDELKQVGPVGYHSISEISEMPTLIP